MWHASVDAAQTLLSLAREKDDAGVMERAKIAGYLYEAVVAITRAINELERPRNDE